MSKAKANVNPERKPDRDRKSKRKKAARCAEVVPITAAKSAKKKHKATKTTRTTRGGSHNKGLKFPPDPPSNEEVVQILRVGCAPYNNSDIAEMNSTRLRALIVVLWRTGLRCAEALDLEERDLRPRENSIVVRCGKGGKRRIIGMDQFGWAELDKWLEIRRDLPSGKLFCGILGDAAGRAMWPCDVRRQFRQAQLRAGVRRRFAPHQLRHKLAVDLRREGVDLDAIQAQLGHAHLGVTEVYFRGIPLEERLAPVMDRKVPMVAASYLDYEALTA